MVDSLQYDPLPVSPFHKLDFKRSSDDNLLMEVGTGSAAGTSPKICVSEDAYQYACKQSARIVHPDDDDNGIRRSLGLVYEVVQDLLSQDQQFFGLVATWDEYRNNVKHFGEDRFIGLLRNTAKENNWEALFQHSILYDPHLTRT